MTNNAYVYLRSNTIYSSTHTIRQYYTITINECYFNLIYCAFTFSNVTYVSAALSTFPQTNTARCRHDSHSVSLSCGIRLVNNAGSSPTVTGTKVNLL